MQKVPQPTEPTAWSLAILTGLGRRGKHVYGGSVPAGVVADRRRKNKVARASRRTNRGQS